MKASQTPFTAPRSGTMEQPSSAGWAAASLSLPMLLSSLDSSIANVALPTVTEVFHASFQEVQWVVLANLLTLTTLIVSAGRLGDTVGRRRLLLAGTLLFTIASACGGIASTLGLLIAARAAQGGGGAFMMALSMALVGETVHKAKTGSAMGLLGTMSAVGTALGPSLGGILIGGLGWRAIFLVQVALGILAFLLARRHLPVERRAPKQYRAEFDHAGTLLLVLTLTAYALAMTIGHGHFGPRNAVLLLAAAAGLVVFAYAEAKAVSPLIRLRMFCNPVLGGSLAMSALVATIVTTTLVVGPFYLSRALGLDPARVGLVLSVGPLVAAITAVPAGRLTDRFSAKRMTIIGLAGIALGTCVLPLMSTPGIVGFIAPVVLITAGYGLFQTSNNTAVMTSSQANERGSISGILNLSRNLGRITGASAMGAVFAMASARLGIAKPPAEAVALGMRVAFSVAAILAIAALLIATRTGVPVARRSAGMRSLANLRVGSRPGGPQ